MKRRIFVMLSVLVMAMASAFGQGNKVYDESIDPFMQIEQAKKKEEEQRKREEVENRTSAIAAVLKQEEEKKTVNRRAYELKTSLFESRRSQPQEPSQIVIGPDGRVHKIKDARDILDF